MATEIRVPTLGESVSEATIGRWFKKAGDPVKADEPLCELETDKVTLEVNAPAAGVLAEITAKDGETVEPGGLLDRLVVRDLHARVQGRVGFHPAQLVLHRADRLRLDRVLVAEAGEVGLHRRIVIAHVTALP